MPFAAGGATDVLPRLFAERLRAELGQPVVIENVSGAGGTVGLTRAAHASPDGYTIASGNWTTFVSNGAVYKTSYDVVTDFEPVILLPANSHLIVGRKDLPPNNLKELVAWVKANQNKVAMATAGVGTGGHFGAVLFQNLTQNSVSTRALPRRRSGAVRSARRPRRHHDQSGRGVPAAGPAGHT